MQPRKLRGLSSHFTVRRTDIRLFSLAPVLVALAVIWPFGGGRKVQMANTQAAPAATGVIHVSKDSNGNTKLQINVKYLAQPGALTPAKAVYVVWIKPNGHTAKDQGVLKVGSDRSGKFEMVTPYHQFAIFVTAEDSLRPIDPSGQKVLTANVLG